MLLSLYSLELQLYLKKCSFKKIENTKSKGKGNFGTHRKYPDQQNFCQQLKKKTSKTPTNNPHNNNNNNQPQTQEDTQKLQWPRRKSSHQNRKMRSIPTPGSIILLCALVREAALSFRVSIRTDVSVNMILMGQICWLMPSSSLVKTGLWPRSLSETQDGSIVLVHSALNISLLHADVLTEATEKDVWLCRFRKNATQHDHVCFEKVNHVS